MIGDKHIIDATVDLSCLGVAFTSKPVVMGGLAMEYYGLRKRGEDIDFIISNPDYLSLAERYPRNKKDMWGDLGLRIGEHELFRSVFRLDYDFYAEGAIECEQCKVVSFEKLFFMKVIAFNNQPEVPKHTADFQLILQYYFDTFQNKDYVANAERHIAQYLAAPNGTIFNDAYGLYTQRTTRL